MCSTMAANGSPRLRTLLLTLAALVGALGPACQPVPIRAVRLIAASDEPPIHIGRSGWTGFGTIAAPRSR